MTTPHFHDLRVAALQPETGDAVTVRFEVPAPLRDAYRFRPGQFLTLRAMIGAEDTRRSYSICSAPEDPGLTVGIKRVEGGLFSSWACRDLKPGDTLAVMTPDGRFGLPDAAGPRVIAAFAAGSGITPILSIMRAVLANEPDSRFFLFYGNRSTASIMFRQQIEDLKDRYLSRLSVFHVLSREQQDVPALNGRLDADKLGVLLRAVLPAALIDQALICGPRTMIEALPGALTGLGVAADRIHVERFTPSAGGRRAAPVVEPGTPPACIATVIRDGARFDIPVAADEALIDAAIRAGRDLPFACKGGMCCTCRAKVVEGRVDMAVNYSLEPWEIAAGFVLTCQSRPVTDRVVVDFDQV
jgi:ring-1,2-phenylacetyl-CoA epoxidase subunit PaaE